MQSNLMKLHTHFLAVFRYFLICRRVVPTFRLLLKCEHISHHHQIRVGVLPSCITCDIAELQ